MLPDQKEMRKVLGMPDKLKLDHFDCFRAAKAMHAEIRKLGTGKICIYGVPRGGIPVAYLLAAADPTLDVMIDPGIFDKDMEFAQKADDLSPVRKEGDVFVIVDDIVDSGITKKRWEERTGGLPFFALTDFLEKKRLPGQWVVFPWEESEKGEDESATDAIVRLLQFVGEDVTREGLRDTPQRVLKAWKHWTSGYAMDPKEAFKIFKDGAAEYDEMLWENNLPFYSMCEHHMAPFFGTITIAYLPSGAVCGLSKFKRLVDIFARRLQMQERLTVQIADAIAENLSPDCGVVVKARHLCKESRGVAVQGSFTTSSALRGKFKSDATVRAEFLSQVNGK